MTKRVFFLGAGFSKAIDDEYPLMKELIEIIMKNLKGKAARGRYDEIEENIKSDVEVLLSYLLTDFPTNTDTIKYANYSLYYEILNIIYGIFEEFAKNFEKKKNLDNKWNAFSKYIQENAENCSFITLNYDILLEDILSISYSGGRKIFGNLYPYPMKNICTRNGRSSADGYIDDPLPIVIKLHGSANWFLAGRTPSDEIYYRTWESFEVDDIDMGLKPYIIPPVMDKNAFYNHIAIHSLWKRAEQLLKDAEEIYIIGFSFPQTDLSVKYLFQSALRDSTAQIYVVNANTWDNLKKNYEEVFGENRVNTTYTNQNKEDKDVSDKKYNEKESLDTSVTERFIEDHLLQQGVTE